MAGDRVQGHPCPKCGGPAVYNGNYYCESWDTGASTGNGCRWAMREGSKRTSDVAMVKAYLEQRLAAALKRGAKGADEAERMRFYLAQPEYAD